MPRIVSGFIQLHPFRILPERVEYLVLRRAPEEVLYPDILQVVTGTVEPGEDSRGAALRELQEETGLEPLSFFSLPTIAPFYIEEYDQIVLSPIFACRIVADAEPVLSAEHSCWWWLPLEEAVARLEFPSHREGTRMVDEYLRSNNQAGG